MGSVLGTAVSGVGGLVGNVIAFPLNVFSCKNQCSGIWDLLCFIEHLCITNVLKFIMAVILVLFVLYAGYILCKLGVVKCLAKNACKVVYMPCWVGFHVLRHLWRKVQDTERVYRGRSGRRQQPDVELGDHSTSSYDSRRDSLSMSSFDYSGHRGGAAAGRSKWESSSMRGKGKNDRIRQSLRPRRANSKVEHSMRVSRESERRHPHHLHSIGARRKEETSSVQDHGSAARGLSHADRHKIGAKRKEEASPVHDHGSAARDLPHADRHNIGAKRKEEASPVHDHGLAARDHLHAHHHLIGDRRKEEASSVHDHGSAARNHSLAHRHSIGDRRKEAASPLHDHGSAARPHMKR